MAPLLLVGAALAGAAIYFFDADPDRRRRRRALDDVLVKRVRSKMGRYVAHPGAIEVSAAGGKVTLSGSILAHEHTEWLDALRAMHGVADVVDQLSVFETADAI